MSFYQELAETARSAIRSRRARDAAIMRETSELCSFDDLFEDGKVAEKIGPREAEIIQQINELDSFCEGACAVEPTPPTPTPTTTPLQATHEAQATQEKRTENAQDETEVASPEVRNGEAEEHAQSTHEKAHPAITIEDPNAHTKIVHDEAEERAATSSQPQLTHAALSQSRSKPSRHGNLLRDPLVQRMIAKGRTQRKREETRRANKIARNAIPQVPWKRATDDQKFRLASHAADRSGGVGFSLHLSERVQKSLRRNGDPLRSFTHRLNDELKRRGLSGLPYGLTLEQSDADKLHVHGFAIPLPGREDALKQALCAAGGTITGKAGSRQLDLKRLSDGGGCGWASYCSKDLVQTDKFLAGRARHFLSKSMRRIARDNSPASKNLLRGVH